MLAEINQEVYSNPDDEEVRTLDDHNSETLPGRKKKKPVKALKTVNDKDRR